MELKILEYKISIPVRLLIPLPALAVFINSYFYFAGAVKAPFGFYSWGSFEASGYASPLRECEINFYIGEKSYEMPIGDFFYSLTDYSYIVLGLFLSVIISLWKIYNFRLWAPFLSLVLFVWMLYWRQGEEIIKFLNMIKSGCPGASYGYIAINNLNIALTIYIPILLLCLMIRSFWIGLKRPDGSVFFKLDWIPQFVKITIFLLILAFLIFYGFGNEGEDFAVIASVSSVVGLLFGLTMWKLFTDGEKSFQIISNRRTGLILITSLSFFFALLCYYFLFVLLAYCCVVTAILFLSFIGVSRS